MAVVDGANGTELQRLGGKPAETFSSGTSALARPDLCQEVHETYLDSGADIIITHSYSSNRNVMSSSGNGDRACECILSCAAIARRATAVHSAKHASKLTHAASLAQQAGAQAVEACTTAVARVSSSAGSNENAGSAAVAAQRATSLSMELVENSHRAMQEVISTAARANAAAALCRAASEGEQLPAFSAPPEYPDARPLKGWDAAGFGPAIVVGSLSTHPPEMAAGGATSETAKWPSEDAELKNYQEAAQAHGISGVDMLWLEMMKDWEHAERCCKAARTSRLPIFLGISCRTDPETNEVVLFGNGTDSLPLTSEWFYKMTGMLGDSLVGINVMHTNFSTMSRVLKFVREDCGWQGPLGAYPDHGVFKAPEWVFQELDNAEAMEYITEWINDYNVQLVGGCCGTTPEYIRATAALIRRHNANVREQTTHAAQQKQMNSIKAKL